MNATDMNILIIEKVKNFPELYKNSASLEKRKYIWQTIGQMLDVGAPFAISRWHCLLEHYTKAIQKNSLKEIQNFRYRKYMEYFLPYIKNRSAVEASAAKSTEREQQLSREKDNSLQTDYEFVINESDLEELSSDGGSDYNFVEVEDDDLQPKVKKPKVDNDNDMNSDLTELKHDVERLISNGLTINDKNQSYILEEDEVDLLQLEDDSNSFMFRKTEESKSFGDTSPSKMLATIEEAIKNSPEAKKIFEQTDENDPTPPTSSFQEPRRRSSLSDKKPSIASLDMQTNNETSNGQVDTTSKEASSQKESRCEDEIFGELVAAMLKKMPGDKKRSIKREIMNILL